MPTILVYWSEGRSQEQKTEVIDGIIDVMVERGGARSEDVVVIIQDMQPGNLRRGLSPAAAPAQDHVPSKSSD
ncbi:MAG TPA: tautomerase family protein [Phototrophicaceae bacterium]|nr:tautomerase family protein [Phototrophicaceae bacterium]